MSQTVSIDIRPESRASFRNLTSLCVGTGRLDLALHEEYQQQLALAQSQCHFRMIRGHGLFSDQLGILQRIPRPDGTFRAQYCFTYLDLVMDSFLRQGLKPFLELGFMPEALTDSKNTLFYWKAHTAPPRDMGEWTALVQATLRHLCDRYGEAEVGTWLCEIWNEPNLAGFWENADKPAYLALYRATVQAVKEAVPAMKVGGPAICGGEGSQQWIRDFLAFCRDNALPVDFVTRHAYMGNTPEHRERYLYHSMRTVESLMDEMRESRDIIDSFPEYRGMPLYITEFNTSYNPFCPIHDTNYNAALCAALLARLGDVADGYSYWTFGDVFEEQGIPPRPFHGGFGLVANGLIPKPTLWSFAFFAQLKGEAVHRDAHTVVTRRPDGGYEAVLWNLCQQADELLTVELKLPAGGPQAVWIDRVDEDCCNPLRVWHEMGEPASLTDEQLAFLRAAGQPARESRQIRDGVLKVTLAPNAVVRARVLPVKQETDPGYDFGYYRDPANR